MEIVYDCYLCFYFILLNLKLMEMKDIVFYVKFIWINLNVLREYWIYEGYYVLKSGYLFLVCVYWFFNWSEKKF